MTIKLAFVNYIDENIGKTLQDLNFRGIFEDITSETKKKL